MKAATFALSSIGVIVLIGFAFAMPRQQTSVRQQINPESRSAGGPQPVRTMPSSFSNSSQLQPSNQRSNGFGPAQATHPRPANKTNEFGNWLFKTVDGEVVRAELAEPIEFNIETKFGTINVPSKELVSLRTIAQRPNEFESNNGEDENANKNSTDDDAGIEVVVATSEKDIFAGVCKLNPIKIRVKWGEATIAPEKIDFLANRKYGVKTIATNRGQNSSSWVVHEIRVTEHVLGIQPQTFTTTVESRDRLFRNSTKRRR